MKNINVLISGDNVSFSDLDSPRDFLESLYKDDNVEFTFLQRSEYLSTDDDEYIKELDIAFYYPHEFIDPYSKLSIDKNHMEELSLLRKSDCLLFAINDLKGGESGESFHLCSLHENVRKIQIHVGSHDTLNWKEYIDTKLGINPIKADDSNDSATDEDLMFLL